MKPKKIRFRSRTISILVFACFMFGIFSSCDHGFCEAFNFKRLPFNTSYYKQHLTYTNGPDTLTLFPTVVDYSKEARLNSIGNPECKPIYALEYAPKGKPVLDILYSFEYYPEKDFTKFDIIISSSRLEIKLDSLFKQEIDRKKIFHIFEHLNGNDSSLMIRKAVIENMRIIEMETFMGTKWELIKVGN